MKKTLFFGFSLVVLLGFLLDIFQPAALAQAQSFDLQQQTAYYLPPVPVVDDSVHFENAWCGSFRDGLYICGTSPTELTPHDVVYPQTFEEFEFQLSYDAYLGLEYHNVIPDGDVVYSTPHYSLRKWDEDTGDWITMNLFTTGTTEYPDHIMDTMPDDWPENIAYHPNKWVYTAGSYKLTVSQNVRGGTIGYFPGLGDFTVYAWEIVRADSTPTPTPTPPPTPIPTAGPCEIIVSPSSATIKAGEAVDFVGAAITSQGVPMSNALLKIDWGDLAGTGYGSGSSRTDPVGNFSFTYAVSENTNYNKTVTIGVSVGDCPVVKSIPITITGSSSNGNFITNIINQINNIFTWIWNMIMGLFP